VLHFETKQFVMFVRSNTSTQMLAAKRTAQFHHEIPADPYTIQHVEQQYD
jgi:hypothetical protein